MNVLSSFVGAWIALVLFGVVAVLVCIGLVAKLGASSDTPQDVKKGSILTINLSGVIEERESPLDINYISLLSQDIERPQTLQELVIAINEAKENKNISAIYLKCGGVSASLATLNALREAISGFKSGGKPVIAYGDNYGMGDYYVASVANHLYINPAGMIMMQGIGGTSLYLKGLFDKLGVEFQVVKVGTYKSAVEPYIMTEMSEPARAQLDTLYFGIWRDIRKSISSSRKKLTPASIDTLINRNFIFLHSGNDLVKAGLVDKTFYERSMNSVIAKILGQDEKKLSFVSPSTMVSQTDWGEAVNSKRQIAVVYAVGEIVDGGGASTIDYESFVPMITKLADDEKVKGMVLRVNSPGGAVFGSEQIGDALDYFQKKGKPLAVSMGDYAASGGYWISCGADRIFANPLTITGSIGIFGLIPNFEGLTEKLGVSPQMVYTNPEAEFPAVFKPMSERQLSAMQRYVEAGYDKFVGRVAKGRKMPEARVRQIGEGRVWGVGKAVEIGLVDQLGSLQDAIKWTADKAGMGDNYEVSTYPSVNNTFWNMIPDVSQAACGNALAKALRRDYDEMMVRFVMNVFRRKPVQAMMPPVDVRFTENAVMN